MIELSALKQQREGLKTSLREIETQSRQLDGELKKLRQSEIRTKREIEALSTLIELREEPEDKAEAESS